MGDVTICGRCGGDLNAPSPGRNNPVCHRAVPQPASPATVGGVEEMLASLRAAGWAVAVHNDYRLNGQPHTFWLLTHPTGRWMKGEGATDAEALGPLEAAARNEGAAEGAIGGCSKCGGDIGPLASGRHVCPAEGDCVLVPREVVERLRVAWSGMAATDHLGAKEDYLARALKEIPALLAAAAASPADGGGVIARGDVEALVREIMSAAVWLVERNKSGEESLQVFTDTILALASDPAVEGKLVEALRCLRVRDDNEAVLVILPNGNAYGWEKDDSIAYIVMRQLADIARAALKAHGGEE